MTFPFRLFKISGHSMTPTLQPGQLVLAYTKTKNLRQGDLVVFFHEKSVLIKRVFKTLQNKQYVVVGDNRQNSNDSTTFGPISAKNIIGKIIAY